MIVKNGFLYHKSTSNGHSISNSIVSWSYSNGSNGTLHPPVYYVVSKEQTCPRSISGISLQRKLMIINHVN